MPIWSPYYYYTIILFICDEQNHVGMVSYSTKTDSFSLDTLYCIIFIHTYGPYWAWVHIQRSFWCSKFESRVSRFQIRVLLLPKSLCEVRFL